MVEKLVKLGIQREPEYLYFVRAGDVWRVKRKAEGDERLPELVEKAGAQMSPKHILFLDAEGDLARVPMQEVSEKPRKKRAPHAEAPTKKRSPKTKAKTKAKAKAAADLAGEPHMPKPGDEPGGEVGATDSSSSPKSSRHDAKGKRTKTPKGKDQSAAPTSADSGSPATKKPKSKAKPKAKSKATS